MRGNSRLFPAEFISYSLLYSTPCLLHPRTHLSNGGKLPFSLIEYYAFISPGQANPTSPPEPGDPADPALVEEPAA